MKITPAEALIYMRQRGCCKQVVERVLRLNPDGIDPAITPRGWKRRGSRYSEGLFSRAQVVMRYGPDAWDNMPLAGFIKSGKRREVRFIALADEWWKLPPNDRLRKLRAA